MLKKIKNFIISIKDFILRITLCALTFHIEGSKTQSAKAHDIYVCGRCGNPFAATKKKYKK